MIKILFICHGNICRSTMAESVMTYLVEKEGLADRFYINSAATSRGDWQWGASWHCCQVEERRDSGDSSQGSTDDSE